MINREVLTLNIWNLPVADKIYLTDTTSTRLSREIADNTQRKREKKREFLYNKSSNNTVWLVIAGGY